MTGVAIIIGEGLAEADLFGDLAAIAAAVGFAGFSVCIRRGRHTDISPTILIAAAVTVVVSGTMALASGARAGRAGRGCGSGRGLWRAGNRGRHLHVDRRRSACARGRACRVVADGGGVRIDLGRARLRGGAERAHPHRRGHPAR